MNRLRFILLFVVVLLAGRAEAYDFESGGLCYNILSTTDKTVEVTLRGEKKDWETTSDYVGNIIVPSTVESEGVTYTIKRIGDWAFCRSTITSITIEEGVESIENNAFQFCNELSNVSLPSSLKSIGSNAFYNNNSSYDLVIPEGVNNIGSYAFAYSGIKTVELPSTLTSIESGAFVSCNSLTSVISHIQIPFNLDKNVFAGTEGWNPQTQKNDYSLSSAILYVSAGTKSEYLSLDGWNLFAGIYEGEPQKVTLADGLIYSYTTAERIASVIGVDNLKNTDVTIPATVEIGGENYSIKIVGSRVFGSQGILQSLTIEEGVEIVCSNAFAWCSSLKSVSLPSTLTYLGDYAFYCCNSLTSVVIPEGVQTIARYAFSDCNSLRRVVLPSTLTNIYDGAFAYNSSLMTVISRIHTPFAINTSVFNSSSSASLFVPTNTKASYEAIDGWAQFSVISEGEPVQGRVGDLNYDFLNDSRTATVSDGEYSALNKVTIPAAVVFEDTRYSVVGVGANVFSNTPLRSVTIENGVETIGNGAFRNCYSLKSVVLPESITNIGREAFAWCNNLDTISIPKKVEVIGDNAFAGTRISEIVIPVTTKSISVYAFENCRYVTSISVDPSNSFYDSRNNCNALIETASNTLIKGTSTTIIPNSVVEIANSAFNGASGLTAISIPNSVTTIGGGAFNDCDALTSIYIPSSVTMIYSNPFTNCDALVSMKVDENNSVYDSREDCNAIIETKTNRLVSGCKKSFIPRGIKVIGNSAFNCVNGLDSLKIPYGVETIENYALSNTGLTYVEIPNSIKTIDYYAFGGNYNLISIVSKIKNPSNVNINYGAFYDSNVQYSGILYVPKGKKDAYKYVNGWSSFENIEEMDGEKLNPPSLSYDGRVITAVSDDKDVDMYYTTDDGANYSYYDGPIAVHDLVTVKVFAEKSFSADSDESPFEVKYLYDGETLKQSEAGHMAEAIAWCGRDSVKKMTIVGAISDDEFSIIRQLPNLKFLNLAGTTNESLVLPDNAFAGSSIVSFVAPQKIAGVGSGLFTNCQQLAAINWDTDKALPSDALSDVSNPNLLLYLKEGATDVPAGINNVIVGGTAKKITLVDATGNNNFYCPVAFSADSIIYTRNFKQKTEIGVSRGWETIVLPFTVKTITHETNGTLTPFVSYNGSNSQRPFWLYTLENDRVEAASSIKANVPYLICMPNCDEYGDNYNQAGNVKFAAAKVTIAESKPQEKTQYDITFTPAYQRVAASADVFTLNVNQEYKGYPAGSLFVNNFREVRPFEAYSVHPSQAKAAGARMITVSSLIGGGDDTTGIIDMMLKKNDGTSDADAVIKVYSLSGALVKQGRADEVTKSLPKGIYIANGKKFVVK